METVNIRDAKARFSEYLARVEEGETVFIARRNKPVAKLVAITPEECQRPPRPIGLAKGMGHVGPGFFEPMEGAEMALWDGSPMLASDPMR